MTTTSRVLRRRSVFPPLLASADDKGTAVANNNGCKGKRIAGKERDGDRSAAEVLELMAKEIELKKKQRTEALVRTWDSLLEREKDDRHTRLLHRLDLQRRLIAKNDLVFQESLKADREKRAQEIQSRKEQQQRMIQELRAHSKRIAEHKKMVAKKVEKRNLSRCASNLRPSSERVVSPELSHLVMTGKQQREEGEDSGDCGQQASNDIPPGSGHTSRLQQLLSFDPRLELTPTISHAWRMMKHEHARKLQPILEYSNYTRESANPTSRVLLRCYDQPVQISNIGERVPLSDLVEEEVVRRQMNLGRETILARVVEQRTRRNQARGEALLCNKQSQVAVPIQEPTMYLPTEEYEHLDSQTLLRSSPRPPQLKHISPTNLQPLTPCKKLRTPKYLLEDGSLLVSECENEKRKDEEKAITTAFLTDQCFHTEESPVVRYKRGGWQPLSCTAAGEYDGTRVIPVKAFSSQAHGRYSLWKPLSSNPNSSPVLDDNHE